MVDKMKKELPERKPTRLGGFDYSTTGAYFLTICTENKQKILSDIVGGDVLDAPQVELSQYGKIAEKHIKQMDEFYDNISIDGYVIMPNHIHIMLFVFDGGASRTSHPTPRQHSGVSRFVSTFKRFCNKEYGHNIWQKSFNDHVIRGQNDYYEHLKYIEENPLRWRCDDLYI